MRKILSGILIVLFSIGLWCGPGAASLDPSYVRTAVLSKVDLRKYFEEAMSLFENGKYKEAIALFERLIEVEEKQGEPYFTPFAEIYIDKSKARMSEMLVLQYKKLEKMKQDVVSEAEKMARQEEERIVNLEEMRRIAWEEARRKQRLFQQQKIQLAYKQGMEYYKQRNYPLAIVVLKKIKEIDPVNELVPQAESLINDMRKRIKKDEERLLLARMEGARLAKLEMERQKRIREAERQRKEVEKIALKRVFEQRLKAREAHEKIAKVTDYMDSIIKDIKGKDFDQAIETANRAISELPENEKFKETLHYIETQRIKTEEDALKKARELTEERMLLDVAREHILPEEKTGALERKKKITPLVKVPEIRKRLKIPISVDFKDVGLDYVLAFLSDATGVNIVPSTQIDISESKVTMKIKNMPLEEALMYILKSLDLVYRIEEDAVWIATKEELDNEKVETRVYFLNEGVGRFAEFITQAKGGDLEGSSSSSSISAEVKTVKDVLQNAVEWPKESKLTLDDRTGALIVSNIPSNLEIVENLLYNLDITPVQVLIEAKFLEVKVTDTDELGFEWILNSDWGAKVSNSRQALHGVASGSGVGFSDFSRSDEGFNLTYQGILSHPQFQAALHALQERQNVKTLSAPSVTTMNNQAATIEVIDEYIYPTRYEVSLVQYDINGDGDFDDAGETEWANIPQDFVTRNVGIMLHVKPSVGVDGKNITLALTPEVSEASGTQSYSGSVTIPQFTTRNLSTSVIIKDGETVVMGGLIKETNTTVKTKVPLLGDMPFVGGLFRKSTDSTERRNLLIFVTASVMNRDEDRMASVLGGRPAAIEQ
ncbi:MAG: tetratricopeptide repeat protein [Candidatus Omnitrophota bacterium]